MACLARIVAAVWLVALASGAAAQDAAYRARAEHDFHAWLGAAVWPEAKAAGVSRATFDRATGSLTLDWTLPELEPPGLPVKPPAVEWQAEFGSPGAYFNEKRLSTLARLGRARLDTWRKTLGTIAAKYGVPPAILVAIWAKEFGLRPGEAAGAGAQGAGDRGVHGTPARPLPPRAGRRSGHRRDGRHRARPHALVMGRRARPAAVPALALLEIRRRFRWRRPPRHLGFGARQPRLDGELPQAPKAGSRSAAGVSRRACRRASPARWKGRSRQSPWRSGRGAA